MSIQPYWRKPGTTTAFNNASPAAPQSVLGTDDHLQLLGMLDDMFGQLCGGGGIFGLLLLAHKAVVVAEAQDPPSLLGIVCHLLGCVEEEKLGSLGEEDFRIGLLHASSNLTSDSLSRMSMKKVQLSAEMLPLARNTLFCALH